MLTVELTTFGTQPVVIHAQGHHVNKPHWFPIRDAFFASPVSREVMPAGLTIITCNNGNEAMGRFEKSLDHLGLPCLVLGQGVSPWVNSRDKPRLFAEAAQAIETEYILYADSRDAILIQPPSVVLDCYLRQFSCDLLFGGDRLSYPPVLEWRRHEDRLPGATQSEFRYLNAGAWIGRTSFIQEFFAIASRSEPLAELPDSEQGILRKILPRFPSRIGIDYRCEIFLNLGFLLQPVIKIQRPDPAVQTLSYEVPNC
jgi:hypothetical protein